MDFRLVHEVCPSRWKEITSHNIRSNIVRRRSCCPPSEIHICEHPIITRLDMAPPIRRYRACRCTLRLEVRIDRSPSCRIEVFHGETIPILILLRERNAYLQCHSIESSLPEYSIIYSSSEDILSILIRSLGFIDQFECTIDAHTKGTLCGHIEDTLRPVSRDDGDIDGYLCTIALQGEVVSHLETTGFYLPLIRLRS